MSNQAGRPFSKDVFTRLSGSHFPVEVPSTHQRKHAVRRCTFRASTTLGQSKRREIRYMCKTCAVPLCIVSCFEIYHTKPVY